MRVPIGKFYVSMVCMEHHKERAALSDMLIKMRFVPTRVEFLYHRAEFEFIGFSPMFNEVDEGSIVPEYAIECSRDKNGTIISVHGNQI